MTETKNMQTLREALEPCPFCGSQAEMQTDGDSGYWIECTNAACGSSTNIRIALMDDVKPLVAEQWNRRATAQAPEPEQARQTDEQVSYLTEALENNRAYVDDLSSIVMRLVHDLRKVAPDNKFAGKALEYLQRNKLTSPLRTSPPPAPQTGEQAIGNYPEKPDSSFDTSSAWAPQGTAQEAVIRDALNTVLWLEHRLPKGYGDVPHVKRTIAALEATIRNFRTVAAPSVPSEREAVQEMLRELDQKEDTIYRCSNPACGVEHTSDPRGHCPVCIAPTGAGWSCYPDKPDPNAKFPPLPAPMVTTYNQSGVRDGDYYTAWAVRRYAYQSVLRAALASPAPRELAVVSDAASIGKEGE